MRPQLHLSALFLLLLGALTARAADFVPDPASVQREGPAYRYPQAGWIVLHIEGEPYERGYQHGKLMANEIADYVKCYATMQSPKSSAEAWKITRTMVDSLFARKFDPEYLEEMKGIADGAVAGGAGASSESYESRRSSIAGEVSVRWFGVYAHVCGYVAVCGRTGSCIH